MFAEVPPGESFWAKESHEMKPESPNFLQRKLGELPSKGGFVKLNRVLELFGPTFCSWEDSLKVSPREA